MAARSASGRATRRSRCRAERPRQATSPRRVVAAPGRRPPARPVRRDRLGRSPGRRTGRRRWWGGRARRNGRPRRRSAALTIVQRAPSGVTEELPRNIDGRHPGRPVSARHVGVVFLGKPPVRGLDHLVLRLRIDLEDLVRIHRAGRLADVAGPSDALRAAVTASPIVVPAEARQRWRIASAAGRSSRGAHALPRQACRSRASTPTAAVPDLPSVPRSPPALRARPSCSRSG